MRVLLVVWRDGLVVVCVLVRVKLFVCVLLVPFCCSGCVVDVTGYGLLLLVCVRDICLVCWCVSSVVVLLVVGVRVGCQCVLSSC